jgi:hypothetical protein
MGIGDVFAKAFELWRRDVGWLILAGLVIGLIMVVIFGVVFGIFAAIFAGAGLTLGANMASSDSGAAGALGAGMLMLGVIVYIIALFLVQVVAMVFYGGMFEMVIGAARGNRGVAFGDLFSGFRKFGAYAVYALVLFGISIGTSLLGVIPVIGAIAGLVISIWIGVVWLYVLPLIADQGIGFGPAARRSNEMVKGVGWWSTFGMVIVLGLVVGLGALVILLVAVLVGQASDWAGILLGFVLFLVFAVLVPPYTICYVSVMYLGSGGAVEPAAAGGLPGGPPPPPPYGTTTYGMPTTPTVAAPAPGPATAVTAPPPPPPVGPEAWKTAADPLAAASPAVLPVPPAAGGATAATQAPADAGGAVVPQASADDGGTAVTQVPEPSGPEAPEAPPAPEPPQAPQG